MVQRVLIRAAAAAVVTAVACGFPEPAPFTPGDGGGSGSGSGDGRVAVVALPAKPNRAVDVLFVVANTPTMGSLQADLSGSFHGLLPPLLADDNGLPDVHIGFITSDLGVQVAGGGTGPDVGQCAGSGQHGQLGLGQGSSGVTGNFISDVAVGSERQENYQGDLGDLLAKVAKQGTNGCPFEQPIAAVRAAMAESTTGNANFFRPTAQLAVIVVDDHDDCSAQSTDLFSPGLGDVTPFRCFSQGVVCAPDQAGTVGAKLGCQPRGGSPLVTPVSAEATSLLGMKGDPRELMFGVLAGPTTPVTVAAVGSDRVLAPACSYNDSSGSAALYPSVRLTALAASLPGARTVVQNACDGSLAQQLDAMGVGIRQLVGDPCVEDTLPTTQDCVVDVVRDSDPTHPTVIPSCDVQSTTDCWNLVIDATHCPDADHQRLQLQLTTALPDDAWTYLRCAL